MRSPRVPRYPDSCTAQAKAAALQFSLNKSHACIDGKKRLAMTAMEWLLLRTGFPLPAANESVVEFALAVVSNALSRGAGERWPTGHAARDSRTVARRGRWSESRAGTLAAVR